MENENVTKTNDPTISCAKLNAILNQENLVVLMTAMNNPVSGKTENMPNGYIPGALFFDFENEVCDPHSGLPHTMPSAELFERKVRESGITNESIIVVYDNVGIYCSPRVWWMFKAMGHNNVFVLDGGFPAWQSQGFEQSSTLAMPSQVSGFKAYSEPSLFCGASDVLEALNDGHFSILDARSYQRFYGQVPEPREGLRSGHIPHSKNLHYADVLNSDQTLRSRQELDNIFTQLGANKNKKLIFSCGSGVTACILALAARRCGYSNLTVYDGSWSDWGADSSLPVSLLD